MRNGGLPQTAAHLAELKAAIHGEDKLVHDKLPPGGDPVSGCLLSRFYRYAAHYTHVVPAARRKVSDLCARLSWERSAGCRVSGERRPASPAAPETASSSSTRAPACAACANPPRRRCLTAPAISI